MWDAGHRVRITPKLTVAAGVPTTGITVTLKEFVVEFPLLSKAVTVMSFTPVASGTDALHDPPARVAVPFWPFAASVQETYDTEPIAETLPVRTSGLEVVVEGGVVIVSVGGMFVPASTVTDRVVFPLALPVFVNVTVL